MSALRHRLVKFWARKPGRWNKHRIYDMMWLNTMRVMLFGISACFGHLAYSLYALKKYHGPQHRKKCDYMLEQYTIKQEKARLAEEEYDEDIPDIPEPSLQGK